MGRDAQIRVRRRGHGQDVGEADPPRCSACARAAPQREDLSHEERAAAAAAVRRAAVAAPLCEMHATLDQTLARVQGRVESKDRAAAAAREAPRAAARAEAKNKKERDALEARHRAEDAARREKLAASINREKDEIRRQAYTTRGKHDEKDALRRAAAERGLDPDVVDASSNAAFFRRELRGSAGGGGRAYAVVGYVDGLTDDYVIEVKNRMHRLFTQVPLYEKVQMHAYMVLTERPRCLWVQRYQDQQESRMVEFDKAWWEGCVLPALHAAVDRYHAIMESEKEQGLLLGAVEGAWRPRSLG